MAPQSTTTILETCKEVSNEESDTKKIVENLEASINLQKYKFLFWEFETPLKWINIISIFTLHLLAVYYLWEHNYAENMKIVLYSYMVGFISGFGVTAGAHRYYTHKSYKANVPLRILLLFCYTVSGQNSLFDWVRDHRVHHKFSETDADPHNSRRGFFFSHVGWLMMEKHPEVKRKGKTVDCSDLFEDPLVVFHQRYFIWLKLLLAFILPTIVPPLLWGETWSKSIKAVVIARYILTLNFVWSVNSVAHIWGNKPYDKTICPVENLAVSWVALGEGFHNYHHTFPWDYRAAELKGFFNVTTFYLDLFKRIGWAYDMKTSPDELVRSIVSNKGDGSHYKWGREVPEHLAEIKGR